MLAAVAFGIAIGAVAGILFAPQSGEEARDYLTKTAKGRLDDAMDAGKGYARRAQDTFNTVQEHAQDIAAVGERAYREARNS
jgi:gas vesicle protein